MKTKMTKALLAATLLLPCLWALGDKPFDQSDYKQVEYNMLRGAPEDYKNKLVSFNATFGGLRSDFPRYLEDMGFKDDKYFLILTGFHGFQGGGLPIIAHKSPETKDALSLLREGHKVIVYGKVKRFQHTLVNRSIPEYYVEAEKVDELDPADTNPAVDTKAKNADSLEKLDKAVPKPPKDFGNPN